MSQWDDVQKKAKKLMDEAVKLIKLGIDDAELIATKTAKAAQLHTTIRKNQIARHKKIHEIGAKVYEKLSENAQTTTLDVDKTLKDIVSNIKEIERESAEAEKKLDRFTIVTKSKSKSKKNTQSSGKGRSA